MDALDPVGVGDAVGVEPGDDVELRGVVPRRGRRTYPGDVFEYKAHPHGQGDGCTVINAPVVDDDDLVSRDDSLRRQRPKAAAKMLGIVFDRDDDGD